MPMPSVLLFSTLLWLANAGLITVFVLAAVAKLSDRQRARESLLGFGVPEHWSRPGLVALIVLEVLIAALLAYPPTQQAGAWSALVALAVFSLALGWQLVHGRRPACACFGALTASAISWKSVGRNLLLMLLAIALIVLPNGAIPVAMAAMPTLIAVAWGLISAAWLLLLTRQNGRLLVRLEQLEQRDAGGLAATQPAAGPLHVGEVVPPLGLRDANARSFDLDRVRGTPTLLLFLDAACSHCRSLLTRLRETTPTGSPAALIVISDSVALRADLPADITLLVDPGWSTTTLFGLRGTPAAVMLDAEGVLAQGVVHGVSAVHAALNQVFSQEIHHELAPV
jgi:hypothetical protein